MPGRTLNKKPLVEAIVEVRWALSETPNAISPFGSSDPYYRLLLGRFSERVRETYPAYQALPAASIPDGMVPYVVQHQFRVAQGDWPLLQLGPGILTVNETVKYDWAPFSERATRAVHDLYGAHPELEKLKIEQLTLRFLDAIPFDRSQENLFDFLREKLKIGIALPDTLFTRHNVSRAANTFVWQVSFPCKSPPGIATMKIGIGEKDGQTSVILDTAVESRGINVPLLPGGFSQWAVAAHDVTSDWFFDLIEGELHESFDPA